MDERQKCALIELFNSRKQATFKSLLRLKDESRSPYFPSDALFNLDTPARGGKLFGNATLIDLLKPEYLGDLVHQIPYEKLNIVVAHLIDPLIEKGGRLQVEEKVETIHWLKTQLPECPIEQLEKLYSMKFPRQTMSMSYKFLNLIVPIMREGISYDKAVLQVENENGVAFHHSLVDDQTVFDELPYYGEVLTDAAIGAFNAIDANKPEAERDNNAYHYGKVANPTVHIALNQLRFVTNTLIHKFKQKPNKIAVELARDLKNSLQDRKKIEKQNSVNRKKNDEIKEKLKKEFNIEHPSRDDIVKVKLWEELGNDGVHKCVFSGKPICCRQLFDGSVEVEHIIPFKRSYDDGYQNKTLAFKEQNLVKGSRTPHEAFGQSAQYGEILQRALRAFGQTSKFERFKEDAYERFYGNDGNFIERQLNDTRYIAKLARRYLGAVVGQNNVIPVNGQLTALLRKVWQLNHFKDRASPDYRLDHRHHIVDAFVVGCTNRGLINQVNTINAKTDLSINSLFALLKDRSKLPKALHSQLFEKLKLTNASHKKDHGLQGSLSNDTAYGHAEYGGEAVLVTRKAIESLSVDELFQIRDKRLRHDIFEHLISYRNIENKAEFKRRFKGKLDSELKIFAQNTGHRKVRINVKSDTAQVVKSAPYKAYGVNNYAYVDIWKIPKKFNKSTQEWEFIYKGDFVLFKDVKERVVIKNENRPHHAAKHVMRLFKQDTISLINIDTSEKTVMRVAGFSATNNKFDLQPNLVAISKKNQKSINEMFKTHKISKKLII